MSKAGSIRLSVRAQVQPADCILLADTPHSLCAVGKTRFKPPFKKGNKPIPDPEVPANPLALAQWLDDLDKDYWESDLAEQGARCVDRSIRLWSRVWPIPGFNPERAGLLAYVEGVIADDDACERLDEAEQLVDEALSRF